MVINLWNFIQFQVGWFALVLSAAAGDPRWGGGVMVVLVIIHLLLERQPLVEGSLLLVIAIVGWCWETLVQTTGWLQFAGYAGDGVVASWLAPLKPAPWWMALLWVNFATTLDYSLAWLRSRKWQAALAGAVGGPLAFVAGEELGAVRLLHQPEIFVLLAMGWLAITPAVLTLAGWLKSGGSAQKSMLPACNPARRNSTGSMKGVCS